MRKKGIMKAALCLAFVFVFIFANMVTVDKAYAASKIKISKTSMTLCAYETQTLKVTGTSKKVTWKSSNKKVAKVRNKLMHKAEDLLMETGCICPLYYYKIIGPNS